MCAEIGNCGARREGEKKRNRGTGKKCGVKSEEGGEGKKKERVGFD